MSDVSRVDAATGPDGLWSEDHPPSRGQYRTIAVLACQLLGIDPPRHRLDASIAISRLRSAQLDPDVLKSIKPARDIF